MRNNMRIGPMDDLTFIRSELQRRSLDDLRRIAEAVPSVSYSWLEKIRSDRYESEPLYSRVRRVAEYLRAAAAEVAQ